MIPDFTVVMPCLNEEKTIGECIKVIHNLGKKENINIPIIVADNGSTDRSIEIASELGAQIVNISLRGYGSALDEGIRASKTEWVVIGDSDMSYDFMHSADFVIYGDESHSDLVIGNRFRGGVQRGAMPALHKYVGNPALSYIAKIFFNIPIGDFHCGLRAIKRQSYLQADPRSKGMEYATEMIIKFADKNMIIAELPTTLKKDGRDRKPHLRSFPDGWRHLKLMMLYAPQFTLLFPGLFLTGLGLFLLGMFSLIGKINFLSLEGDVSAAVIAALISLIGAQLFVAGSVSIANAKARGVGKFRWVLPKFSSMRKKITLGVPLALISISGTTLCYFAFTWLLSGQKHIDPVDSTRITITSTVIFLIGTQLLIGAIQVRQIVSEFWS